MGGWLALIPGPVTPCPAAAGKQHDRPHDRERTIHRGAADLYACALDAHTASARVWLGIATGAGYMPVPVIVQAGFDLEPLAGEAGVERGGAGDRLRRARPAGGRQTKEPARPPST